MLEITVGDEVSTASPDDEVYIPRDVVHSVKNAHGGRTRWLFGYD